MIAEIRRLARNILFDEQPCSETSSEDNEEGMVQGARLEAQSTMIGQIRIVSFPSDMRCAHFHSGKITPSSKEL